MQALLFAVFDGLRTVLFFMPVSANFLSQVLSKIALLILDTLLMLSEVSKKFISAKELSVNGLNN